MSDEREVRPMPWLEAPLTQALAMPNAHAILIAGAPGAGSLQLAALFARALLCEAEAGVARPCDRCTACRAVASRLHPDLHWLVPEELRARLGWSADDDGDAASRKERKPSKQIRIDDVRAAIDWIVGTSSRGRAKVLLVHPAEALNVQSANALLKTLEEPPRGARIVLTAAEPEKLLPTVRSRCQRVRLAAPPSEDAAAWLAAQGVRQPALLLAATSGLPLDALGLADAGIDGERWAALAQAAAQGNAAAFAGWTPPRVIDALQRICHDAMAIAVGGAPRFFPGDRMPARAELSALQAWSRELAELASRAEHPWNEALLLERLMIAAQRALRAAPRGSATTLAA